MAKSNRASVKRAASAEIERQSKIILLAALARKFGEDAGGGVRRIALTEDELLNVPAGEELRVAGGQPDGSSGGLTITVTRQPPAPAPMSPEAQALAERGAAILEHESEVEAQPEGSGVPT